LLYLVLVFEKGPIHPPPLGPSILSHGSHATMLAFFPNSLDLLDRVISNFLDGFLLRAASTISRVAASGVVSTT
jgi:hypothetical protein